MPSSRSPEAALSHRVGNAESRSYNRADLLDRRRPLMAAWANYVTGDADSNVVPLRPLAQADAS